MRRKPAPGRAHSFPRSFMAPTPWPYCAHANYRCPGAIPRSLCDQGPNNSVRKGPRLILVEKIAVKAQPLSYLAAKVLPGERDGNNECCVFL